MIRSEETIREAEEAAARQRCKAVECETATKDLAANRDRYGKQEKEITRQANWWAANYPENEIARMLGEAVAAMDRAIVDTDALIAEKAAQQQKHEVSAAELEELARIAQAEWEAEHGRKVATGDRATKAQPTVEPVKGVGPMVEALANPPAGPQLPPGVAPIDPRSAEVTAVDGASE